MAALDGVFKFAEILSNFWFVFVIIGAVIVIGLIGYFGYIEYKIYIMPSIQNMSFPVSHQATPVQLHTGHEGRLESDGYNNNHNES